MTIRIGSVSPLSFGTPAIWTRSDDPGVILDGGDPEAFTSIPNQGSIGGLIEQGTEANRPTPSTLKKRQSALFDGSTEFLVDNWATASNRFLHDGTGCTVLVVVRRSTDTTADRVCGTSVLTATTDTGLRIQVASADSIVFRIGNGGGVDFLVTSNTGSLLANDTQVIWARHKSGETPEWEYGLGSSTLASGSYTGSPAAGDPDLGLRIGEVSGNHFIGHIPELIAYPEYLAAANIQALINDYLHPRWK